MEQKIQELTEKIYHEGVQKGQEKVDAMLREAREQADRLIADARAEAEKTLADARKQAEEARRVADTEIKLAGNRAVSTIKQQIASLVMARLVDDSTTAALSDPNRIVEIILELVKNWRVDGESRSMEVILPESRQEELMKSLEKGASDLLKKGLDVRFSASVKGGFRIGPSGSQYKISFTDDDFKEFFKEYLKPRTRTFLFGA
jgi:V/A-type H+/Na+-transporting ATPase subunit E